MALMRRAGGRAAAIEPAAEAGLPEVLDPLRVLADQVRDQVLQHPLRRVRQEMVGGIAVAHDARIGLDLEEDVAAGQDRLDAGDLHARALCPSAAVAATPNIPAPAIPRKKLLRSVSAWLPIFFLLYRATT